jgi:hypothetical protein
VVAIMIFESIISIFRRVESSIVRNWPDPSELVAALSEPITTPSLHLIPTIEVMPAPTLAVYLAVSHVHDNAEFGEIAAGGVISASLAV